VCNIEGLVSVKKGKEKRNPTPLNMTSRDRQQAEMSDLKLVLVLVLVLENACVMQGLSVATRLIRSLLISWGFIIMLEPCILRGRSAQKSSDIFYDGGFQR
jgi:hypothetical protein